MKPTDDIVIKFFEDFQRAIDLPDTDLLASIYSEAFMFAGPQGVQAVKRDDFLKFLPKRSGYFKSLGLTASKLKSLEETRLDGSYIQVKVYWSMRVEKDPQHPIELEISATYILFQQENELRIVFQLDHQDLSKTFQDLGLLPAKDN